jgi:putative ABC transport system permease protein
MQDHRALTMLPLLLPLLSTQAPRPATLPQPIPVALERRLAAQLRLGVGDTLRLATQAGQPGTLAQVAAIYEPPADPATITRRDWHLRLHLPDLAQLLGAPDRVDRFGIALRPAVSADTASARLNAMAFGYRAYPARVVAGESSQTFRVVSRFHDAIAFISIMASAMFLLCIMLLKVEERRRDTGLLRFTGISRRTIFLALLAEAVLVAGVGSVLGVLLAAAASSVTNLYYQHLFETTLVFSLVTPAIIRLSVLLSLGLGLVAGAIAAWRLVHTSPLVLWGRG